VIVCNPVLKLSAATDCREEGCLAMPEMRGQVVRSTAIYMEFRTPRGAKGAISLLRMDARIVQHLVDHLDGVLLFDCIVQSQEADSAVLGNQSLKS